MNKECFLTDKGKLDVIFHAECKYCYLSAVEACAACPYFILRWQDLNALKGNPKIYSDDLERELEKILENEIKIYQRTGYIKKEYRRNVV
jgi:hypothetical protein